MTPGNSVCPGSGVDPGRAGNTDPLDCRRGGDKPLADDDDGIVKYESAHLEGVESEVVIRSWHSVQGHPLAIAEVRRILYLDGENACRSAGLCGTSKNP